MTKLTLSENRKQLRKDIDKTENKRDISFLFSLLDIVEKQDKEFIKDIINDFINDWEFCKKAKVEPHIHPRRAIEIIKTRVGEEINYTLLAGDEPQ